MAASPCLFCRGTWAVRKRSRCSRSAGERSASCSYSARGSVSTVTRVTARTECSQVASGDSNAASPRWSPSASTPRTVSSPYLPVPIRFSLPCAISTTRSAGAPRSASTSPGACSSWTNRPASASSTDGSSKSRSGGSSRSSAGMTRTSEPVLVNSTRPSPRVWVSRRLTRYVPPETWVQGSTRSSQREEIPCICGTVLVVVARLRAAAVARLVRACSVSGVAPGPDVGSAGVVMGGFTCSCRSFGVVRHFSANGSSMVCHG